MEIIGDVNLWTMTPARWAIRRNPYFGSAGSEGDERPPFSELISTEEEGWTAGVSKPRDRGFRKDDNSRWCLWVLSVRAMESHGPWAGYCDRGH